MQSIEQITGHHRYTIGNLIEDMAEHATEMNEYLIKTIGPTPLECDERWSNAQKNKKILIQTAQLGLKKVMHGATPA